MRLKPILSSAPSRTRTVVRRIVIIACVCLAPVLSAQPNDPLPVETEPGKETPGKQCEWACERWTKLCNVDPRGVYKCRRTCAKFGQVCE